jgi:hypothetical protein
VQRQSGVYYRSVGKSRNGNPTWGHLLQVSSTLTERTRLLHALRTIQIVSLPTGAANERLGTPPNSSNDNGEARLYQHRTE